VATPITIRISVADVAEVLRYYDQIKVYRSTTGYSGTFSEITVAATRICLAADRSSYEFVDTTGDALYWYSTAYYSSTAVPPAPVESTKSDPQLGDDPLSDNILSVQQLKDIYLFGVDLTNDAGEPFPPIMFTWGIRYAIDWLEKELDAKIRPTTIANERHDYYRRDFQEWMFIRLKQAPILSVSKVALMWPANTEVVNFPASWITFDAESGQINIVPTAEGMSQVLLTAGGSFLPLLGQGREFIPHAIRVDYVAGFEAGALPYAIREVIGKKAAFGPLNIAGDLIAGAGIANQSISMDGLSQSIGTTSSATNAGYGSRLIQYDKEIKQVLPTLKKYYKGVRLTAV
jgi:hypothetical protein